MKKTEGTLIGSPLSPDLYMEFFEQWSEVLIG